MPNGARDGGRTVRGRAWDIRMGRTWVEQVHLEMLRMEFAEMETDVKGSTLYRVSGGSFET